MTAPDKSALDEAARKEIQVYEDHFKNKVYINTHDLMRKSFKAGFQLAIDMLRSDAAKFYDRKNMRTEPKEMADWLEKLNERQI